MMPKIIKVEPKPAVRFGADDVAKLIDEAGLAVRRQAHDFTFITVVRESKKLCRRRINDSQRMRVSDLAQHSD